MQWNPTGDGVDLIFPADVSEAPRSGNLVRFAEGDGRIEDNYENGVGPNSRFRLITGTKNAEIKTVTYMKVEPTKPLANPAPIVTSLEPNNAKVEEVVDRTGRLGYLFVGWNFNTLKNQRVATGAYVARIQYKVTVAGKSPVTGELDQVWGVLRGN